MIQRGKKVKKSNVWPTDITDMFDEHTNETPSLFGNKNSLKTDSLSEKIYKEELDIDEFMAREIDEMTSPKIKKQFQTSTSKYVLKPSRSQKNRFSLFPRKMLSSYNILKKTSEVDADDTVDQEDDKINSYMLPSEDTYKSYDIPHHAKKRFSDFGSLVGFGRNRRQGHQSHGNSRSNRVSHKRRHSIFPEKKNPPIGFSPSKSAPLPRGRHPPAQRYPPKSLIGSAIKHQPAPWPSHKVSTIFLYNIIGNIYILIY